MKLRQTWLNLAVALALLFWSPWVLGPFFVTTEGEGGFGAAWAK